MASGSRVLLNAVSFNQDYSQVAVGTSSGFRVYHTDPFAKWHETREGNITLLEMLFSTSLVALVLSPRRLIITNTKVPRLFRKTDSQRNSTICELTFPSTIRAVRLNRKRLVIVLEDQIYLYDISNMKHVLTIDTSPNHYVSERCYLAYPLPQKTQPNVLPPSHVPPANTHVSVTTGHVLLFDTLTLQAVNVIEAHRTPLSCISMNNDGTRIATASEKGTIIRVFSVPEGQKLFQFRRGSIPARIYSMSFNATSTLLCVSSATDTIHIFKLSSHNEPRIGSSEGKQRRPSFYSSNSMGDSQLAESETQTEDGGVAGRAHDGTFAGMIRRTSQNVGKSFAATVGGYLPSAVSEMLEPARDFAWFKVPRGSQSAMQALSGAVKSVVAMSSNSPQVMVVTTDGQYLLFNIDLERGGEGVLVKQVSILDDTGASPQGQRPASRLSRGISEENEA